MFVAQVLLGPSKQLKQIIQIEHNIIYIAMFSMGNQIVTSVLSKFEGFS